MVRWLTKWSPIEWDQESHPEISRQPASWANGSVLQLSLHALTPPPNPLLAHLYVEEQSFSPQLLSLGGLITIKDACSFEKMIHK